MNFNKLFTSIVLMIFIVGMLPLAVIAVDDGMLPATKDKPMLSAVKESGVSTSSGGGAVKQATGKPMLAATKDKPMLSAEKPKVTREKLRNVLGEKIDNIKESRLDKLSDLRDDRLKKLTDLKEDKLEKLADLREDRLEKLTDLKQDKLEKLADLRQDRLDKLADLKQDKLEQISEMGSARIRKLTELKENKLKEITEDLSDEEIEKLSYLKRDRLVELAKQTKSKVKEELEKVRVVKKAREDRFRERVVDKDVLSKAKETYKNAKEKAEELRRAYEARKNNWKEAKDKLDSCRDTEDNCFEDESDAIESGKEFLLGAAERAMTYFEKLKSKIESSDDISEARAQALVADIDSVLNRLESIVEMIRDATTKDEVNSAAKELRKVWEVVKEKGKAHATKIIQAKLSDLIERAYATGERVEGAVANLEEEGTDVSEIDALLDNYYALLEKTRDIHAQAEEIREDARKQITEDMSPELRKDIGERLKEANEKTKDAKEVLKEAHKTLRDIVKLLKKLGGILSELSGEDVTVIEEIQEETTDLASAVCNDVDGKDILTASYTYGDSGAVVGEFNDFCSNNENGIGHVEEGIYLHEYFCDAGFVVGKTLKCAGGCVEGACIGGFADDEVSEFVDLKLSNFVIGDVFYGEPVKIGFTVDNIGNADINKEFQIEVRICKGDATTSCHIPQGISETYFAEGESKSYSVEVMPSDSDIVNDMVSFAVVVDGDSQITESSELNNMKRDAKDVSYLTATPVVEPSSNEVIAAACGDYMKVLFDDDLYFSADGVDYRLNFYKDTNAAGVSGYRLYLNSEYNTAPVTGTTSGIMGIGGMFNDPHDDIKVTITEVFGETVQFRIDCLNENDYSDVDPIEQEMELLEQDLDCMDYDAGKNLLEKSHAKGFTGAVDADLYDYCSDNEDGLTESSTGDYVHEYFCSEGQLVSKTFECGNGCNDGACVVVESETEVCSDGVDNDGDGYIDCHDGDCSGTQCSLKNKEPTCCLYHDLEVGTYTGTFIQGTYCDGAGKFPVMNEAVCEAMVDHAGYSYVGNEEFMDL